MRELWDVREIFAHSCKVEFQRTVEEEEKDFDLEILRQKREMWAQNSYE